MLACSSSGGHFKQLVSLVQRIPDVGSVTWMTYDSGLSRDLLASVGREDDRLVHAAYAAPRDLRHLAQNARIADRLLRDERPDLVLSTGAGIAVATLPIARARGIRSCFIESATRAEGPSMSGRILRRTPGIELYTQNPGPGYDRRWRTAGSVHDEFVRGPDLATAEVHKVVVSLGTIKPYGFGRLVRRLLQILPSDVEVLWQTGATDVQGLPIDGREHVDGQEMLEAIREADVVVAHAGTGTALTAFELGRCPILVPRRHEHDEHIDDHQVVTARMLARRGLALHVEVDELDLAHFQLAATRTIERRDEPPPLDL